jgi:hypothetical protein
MQCSKKYITEIVDKFEPSTVPGHHAPDEGNRIHVLLNLHLMFCAHQLLKVIIFYKKNNTEYTNREQEMFLL